MLNIFKNIKLGFKLFKLFIIYLIVYLLSFILNNFNIIIIYKIAEPYLLATLKIYISLVSFLYKFIL